MKSIEIFGDSIMKGVMYLNGRYKVYAGDLSSRLENNGIELKRNCRIGSTVSEGLERIKKDLEGKTSEGEIVILEFGGNDSDYDWKSISENPNGTFAPHTSLNKFENEYREAVSFVKGKGFKPVMTTLTPIDAEKYLDFLGGFFSKERILHWLGDVSALYRAQEMYSRRVEKLAVELNVPIIDIREAFLSSRNYKSLFCADGIHPTDEGHKLIEDTVYGFISANA